MAAKRTIEQDPEYEAIPAEIQEKRIKLLEDNVRNQTKKKIKTIIKSNFEQEIAKKDEEIDAIDELLHEGRCMLDRLRACIITKYYATLGQEQNPSEHTTSIHPCVKKYLGKSPKYLPNICVENTEIKNQPSTSQSNEYNDSESSNNSIQTNKVSEKVWESNSSTSQNDEISTRAPRFKKKCKIVVGNISKFIPVWQRDASDHSTHKWMVYVRGDKHNPNIGSFVKKIRFLLHPSYRPSDIVEISNPPFHLVKRGWGEFPVRVQLHFQDSRNKPVDIIHNLKLDKTFTGLQTLGAETVVELQLFKPDIQTSSCNSPLPLKSASAPPLASKVENNVTVHCNGAISTKSDCKEDSKQNMHTIIKKEPNSLVINIKKIKNDTKSDQSSNVNTHKIISSSNGSISASNSDESNSEKKVVPKIVISNNKVTTKPMNIANGINTTFVKCKDNSGRVLLVPQSSVKFKSPPNSTISNNNIQTNVGIKNNTSALENKTVPSYILRVVPNKDSGQNQVFLIPLPEKKTLATSVSIKKEIKDPEEQENPCFVSNIETVIKKEPQFEETVVTSPYISYEQELDNIKLDYYKSFVELLKRVARIFPLIKSGADRFVFTFCANSLEQFLSWNVGKQRASEWRRAGMVRKSILNLLSKKEHPHISPDSVWPQSSIMSWLRKNGFVPMTTEKVTLLPEPKWSGVELCSLTNADDLVSSLQEEQTNLVSNSDDEEIEIVEICNDENKSDKNVNQQIKEMCYLPHFSHEAAFVKNTVSQLDIDLKPIEVEPQIFAPVVEEMILAACSRLTVDLLGSALNEGFNRLGGKICPEEITVSDVYSAIKRTSQFDFLSNSSLGIPKETTATT